MAGLRELTRPEKRRITAEIHDNLVARSTAGTADIILDPFIPKSATLRDALSTHVDDKTSANAERAALLAECDVNDDEVDRWYRHGYWYLDAELQRRHLPDEAALQALSKQAYRHGLAHVNDRIPDQNDEVRTTIAAFRNPEFAGILATIAFPLVWIDNLEKAVQTSDASFAAYQATMGQASSAVALGRDAEEDWVQWARALSNAMALRSSGASAEVVEEGKRIIAPLTNAVAHLRTMAKTRATKKKTTP